MRRPPRRGVVPAGLALSALLAATVAMPAHAALNAGPIDVTALETGAADGVSHLVRLITGDNVIVTGEGPSASVVFQPAADNLTGSASIVRHGKDITVVPDEAQPLLDAGVLDPRLFDVDGLIAQGFSGGRDLPLIIENASGSAEAPAGATRTKSLRSVRGLAATVKAKDAGRMWDGLRSRKQGATTMRLADGVKHVWLDGVVTPQLDKSVPQIGAPQAWAAGYDGTGIKVAVLDSGIDANHPDIAANLIEARNFSTSPDAVDRHGHGTHVASTLVGSGAASGGLYKGVAPKAGLLVGKVLGDGGTGSDSGVIAGMEWAANSGARVINMSLGAPVQSDGTDPVSTALNNVTAATGALFVVAAGNSGDNPTTLGQPAVADAALTVASVDDQGRMATTSSRGPRFRDAALKPDIAAPGVDILAARAAGTAMGLPLNASYTTASGTSMAAPHVAGAAAILAQRRPDWKAADLKGALMASAKVLGHSAFAEGSGRVDIPAALDATVWANNASFGRFLFGQDIAPVARTLTFHNTADRAVTLNLSAVLKHESGTTVNGVLTLDADSITIPARGTRDVRVTAAPNAASAGGAFTGTITATGDGVTAHATVAFLREAQQFAVTVRATMPDGTPVSGLSSVSIYNLGKNDRPIQMRFDANGVATARVVSGRYTVLGHLRNGASSDILTFGLPDIMVNDQDLSLTIDGTKAKPIVVTTPRRSDPFGVGLDIGRKSDEQLLGVGHTIVGSAVGATQYALPSATAQDGRFTLTANWARYSPPYLGTALLPGGQLDLRAEAYNEASRFDGTRRLTVADAGLGTEADLAATAVAGKLALVRRGSEALNTVLKRVEAQNPAGIMVVNPTERQVFGVYPSTRPVFGVPLSVGNKVAAATAKRTVVIRLRGEQNVSYQYNLVRGQKDRISDDQRYAPTVADLASVKVSDFRVAADPENARYTQEGWTGVSTVTNFGSTILPWFAVGTTRQVYLTAVDAMWDRMAFPGGGGPFHRSERVAYEPGSRTEQNWFAPVLHPGTNALARNVGVSTRPSRAGDSMVATIGLRMAGDGRSGEGAGGTPADQNAFRVYAAGQLVGTAPNPNVLLKNLPAQKTTYRFELDSTRTANWWSVSTRSNTVWTFSSAAPAGDARVALPLLEADYDLKGVQLDSTVSANRNHNLTLKFRLGTGDAVHLTDAKVEASYDGGTTWTTQSIDRGSDTVRTKLRTPKNATSASLRVSGTDASGSAITQTVIDAVRIG
ncbi:S8 family serine peptidase [Micromonospora peucetia]|uniref:S8 family serine peptidase n=1 Tax=Micromonospora peucetia TaxID=47871 RepID=UPI003325BBAB